MGPVPVIGTVGSPAPPIPVSISAPAGETAPQPYAPPTAKLPDPPKVPGKWQAQYSRDRKSYVVPGVDGSGSTSTLPRATSHAKVLGDSSGLTDWRLRATVLGLARHPELLDDLRLDGATHLAELDFPAKLALSAVANRAARYAGADDGGDFGTKLHGYLEAVLEGVIGFEQVPEMMQPYLLVIFEAMRRHNLSFVSQMVERVVYIPATGMVGTFDFLVADEHGTLMVGDLKTSSSIGYSWLSIGVQLAQYAGASLILSRDGSAWEPMPEVSRVVGKVISVPKDEPLPCARVYTVNLKLGAEMVATASRVKAVAEAALRAADNPQLYTAGDELMAWVEDDPVLAGSTR